MISDRFSNKTILRSLLIVLACFALFEISASRENGSALNETGPTVVNGGGITGVVRFPEAYPEREKITITKDQQVCRAFQYSEVFIVSEENHGLKNVVITVENVKGRKNAKEKSVATLNQQGCQYIPHVQIVPVNTELQILNNDALLHNVHAYRNGLDPKNTIFNKAQPKFLKKITQTLEKPGIYYFKCDVHEHMSAYVAVVDHPYHAVTDENGQFTIAGVPAGTYTVRAWHEALGTLEKTVTVSADKSAEVKFEILPNE
ncbi:MAG: carboxypeptidase regulatory-like domain-containing protein [bacterium]